MILVTYIIPKFKKKNCKSYIIHHSTIVHIYIQMNVFHGEKEEKVERAIQPPSKSFSTHTYVYIV